MIQYILITLSVICGRDSAPLVEVIGEDGLLYLPAWDGFCLSIQDKNGAIYLHDHIFEDESSAGKFFERVRAHLLDGGDLNTNHWHFFRYTYGSNGWTENVEPELVANDKDPNYMLSAAATY